MRRHTGIRVEELTELSHHSLVQFRLTATCELVPLLAIASSKTDAEWLLVISPELPDVLSAIITRIRRADGPRITEAEREGWTGEAEGLKISLAANNKLAQADLTAARRAEHVHLGIPAYRDITAATLTAPGDPHGH